MAQSVESDRRYTLAEYLVLDEQPESKFEFWDGRLVPLRGMAGASYEHNRIRKNFSRALGNKLEAGPCVPLGPEQRVKIPKTPWYFYPDEVVVCGPPAFDLQGGRPFAITNPRLVVEVLSPSTEHDDRGVKFQRYLRLDSMEEYILISQSQPRVESYYRHPDGTWLFAPVDDLTSIVRIRSLEIELPMAGIYAGLTFEGNDESVTP